MPAKKKRCEKCGMSMAAGATKCSGCGKKM